MKDEKAKRNKTIDISVSEGQEYLGRCLKFEGGLLDLSAAKDRTILGDSFAVLEALPEKSADLIIADPPYNLAKKYGNNAFNPMAESEYEDYTRRWLSAASRLLKDTGSIYVCCDWKSSLIIGRLLPKYFAIRNRITWQREKGRGAAANWKNSMEDIWFATKGDDYTFNLEQVKQRRRVLAPYTENGKPKDWVENESGRFRDTCPSNFWDDISVPFWSMSENTAHPTQKPEKLIAKLMLASSNPGELVLDPFLGSGTTSVVAKKLDRHFIGIEREERYCIFAEKRLEMADSDKSIQGYEDGVFWERNSKK